MSLRATASQTLGPYYSIGLAWLNSGEIAGPGVQGERITVQGRVIDGESKPVSDALIEVWQANAYGKYAHPEDRQQKPIEPGFKGYARMPTDSSGVFRFGTIKPGRVPGPNGTLQAPHLEIAVLMRGLLRHLVTRMYFPDGAANAEDAVLQRVPHERRATLIAKHTEKTHLEWNIILQGDQETVFFDY